MLKHAIEAYQGRVAGWVDPLLLQYATEQAALALYGMDHFQYIPRKQQYIYCIPLVYSILRSLGDDVFVEDSFHWRYSVLKKGIYVVDAELAKMPAFTSLFHMSRRLRLYVVVSVIRSQQFYYQGGLAGTFYWKR